ncbi:MAG: GNAT family N-acetyltransferase [Pseudomonadota bacterium]
MPCEIEVELFQNEALSDALARVPALLQQIPELEQIFDLENAATLMSNSGLALFATADGVAAGFKLGYDRFGDGSFYSWLGGVLPDFRGGHVAQRLLEDQETWVLQQGFHGIFVKTRNRFVGMRILLARNGYGMVNMEPLADRGNSRLLHYKKLPG